MAIDNSYTIVGNLTADPELRFTQSGTPVASFTIAHTERVYNQKTKQWDDGAVLFVNCSLWRDAAENFAESARRGMRVIAVGKLVLDTWTKDDEKRSAIKMEVDEIGPSVRFAVTTSRKPQRGNPADDEPATDETVSNPRRSSRR